MSTTSSATGRHQRAVEALAHLGMHRADHERVGVQCRHSHHVAAVYDTEAGLVYVSTVGPHSVGRGDRPAVPHQTSQHEARSGVEFVELLRGDAMSDDVVPGWCPCGTWSLSRRDLLEAAETGQRHVRLP